jgi:hypothetical protein
MSTTTNYEFKYYAPFGENLFSFSSPFYGAQFWVKEKEVGSFFIDIPHNVADSIVEMLDYDGILEVYRSRYGQKNLLFSKRWLLGQWRDKVDEQGRKFMRLKFLGCNNILARRIIAYYPGTSNVKVVNEQADDALKRLVRENLGEGAVTDRDISDILDIEPNFSLASDVTINNFERVNLLTVLNNICDAAYSQNEEYVTFDLKWDEGTGKYIFKTYVGQLGTNRGIDAKNPLYFTMGGENELGFGGLDYASVDINGIDRRSYIYCGGQGELMDRSIEEVYDDDLIRLSPIGRWEDWEDARNTADDDLSNATKARLEKWLPKVIVNGHMSGAFTRRFGTEINWGDIVVFKFKSHVYDVHLEKVLFVLEADSSEKITIFTRNMKDVYY